MDAGSVPTAGAASALTKLRVPTVPSGHPQDKGLEGTCAPLPRGLGRGSVAASQQAPEGVGKKPAAARAPE